MFSKLNFLLKWRTLLNNYKLNAFFFKYNIYRKLSEILSCLLKIKLLLLNYIVLCILCFFSYQVKLNILIYIDFHFNKKEYHF